MKLLFRFFVLFLSVHFWTPEVASQNQPNIPVAWDNARLSEQILPSPRVEYSPKHVSAEYYYSIPIRTIYKSYPVYHPDWEPEGYFEELQKLEPVILWDDKEVSPKLETETDWIAAGELVFHSPLFLGKGHFSPSGHSELVVRDRDWYDVVKPMVSAEGKIPYYEYVIQEKGKVMLGEMACAQCHSRVMPDGTVLKGAQGNAPISETLAYALNNPHPNPSARNIAKLVQKMMYHVPWDIEGVDLPIVEDLSLSEIAEYHRRMPPGVIGRDSTHAAAPVQVPDLIGIKDRRYLDRTGLQRHDNIGDLMRYSATNQGGDGLSSFGGFYPDGVFSKDGKLPDDPAKLVSGRYSDEQLYALAKYLYSLRPPENPNPFNELAKRGKQVFEKERCARCHKPPHFTNNMLVPAPGFEVPEDHPAKDDIRSRGIGTDGNLTLKTRRGTGLYKVPSLKGVWYRSMFGHSGWCATLEDWFDPARRGDNYVPTGWTGPPGSDHYTVPGHRYGLDLDPEDKRALIAYLKTL